MQSFKNKTKGLVLFLTSRGFAASVLAVLLAGILGWSATRVNTIAIYDEKSVLFERTFKQNPHSILADNGIMTFSNDVVNFTGIANGYGEISITRAFPVTLTVDGQTQTCRVLDGTVDDLLEKQGVIVGPSDTVHPALHQPLSKDMSVQVARVSYATRKELETLPHETEFRSTPLLRVGQSEVIQFGIDGQAAVLYQQRLVNGQLAAESLLSRTITKEAVPQIVLQGGGGAVSPLNFGVPLDKNGVPFQYKKVLTNQVATGYNGGGRAWGASGEWLSAGSVAVHPDKIPYGTRMYITSADGSFVYGFAVAADTGTGLLDHVIDVDLYYDTYRESCLNGRQIVSIYILD